MTASEHDAKWWQQFTVAPPELQRAMHSTLRARETLELRSSLGIDDDAELAVYEQRLKEHEQTEQCIRKALHQRRAELPSPRKAPEATRARAAVGSGLGSSPTGPGPDHYW